MTLKRRVITLTNRAPVKINEADWPTTARGHAAVNVINGTPLPSYQCASWRLAVRKDATGRALVYGVAAAPSQGWPTHGAADWRGGELVSPVSGNDELVAAIQRVGRDLVEHGGAPESVVRECIASLPAEQI